VSEDEYRQVVRRVELFLSGKSDELMAGLHDQMMRLSDALDFEGAARLRDSIRALRETVERQAAVFSDGRDLDVIGVHGHENGAALAIGFDGKGGGDRIGYLCAFIAVGCFSTAIILLRKISGKDSVESVQFWRLLAVCVVGFIGMVVNGVSISFDSTFLILVVSSVLSLAGSFLFNYALKNTPSTNVVQFHYTQIIYGGVLGYLIWHEVPSWHLAAGAVLIIGSGLVVAANTRKLERGRPLTAQ